MEHARGGLYFINTNIWLPKKQWQLGVWVRGHKLEPQSAAAKLCECGMPINLSKPQFPHVEGRSNINQPQGQETLSGAQGRTAGSCGQYAQAVLDNYTFLSSFSKYWIRRSFFFHLHKLHLFHYS